MSMGIVHVRLALPTRQRAYKPRRMPLVGDVLHHLFSPRNAGDPRRHAETKQLSPESQAPKQGTSVKKGRFLVRTAAICAIFVTVSTGFLCLTATASAADPRLCGNTSKPTCAGTAARKALTNRITQTLHPVGQIIPACHPLTNNLLRYQCLAHDAGGHTWQGWITFKKLAGGWHTYVTVRTVNG